METNTTPDAIGIIMDGNRRYAREKGIPEFEGHNQGLTKLKDVASWAFELGIKELTVYAFSTENWNRSTIEVNFLLSLFERAMDDVFKEFEKEQVSLRFIGDFSKVPEKLAKQMKILEEKSQAHTEKTLVIAFSYGGRAEIVAAANMLRGRDEPITEEIFQDALWTKGLKNPDLIIRTGGDFRLSNFLPWQSTYSELFFTQTKWPAFTKGEFLKILLDFSTRERRLGT